MKEKSYYRHSLMLLYYVKKVFGNLLPQRYSYNESQEIIVIFLENSIQYCILFSRGKAIIYFFLFKLGKYILLILMKESRFEALVLK